MEKCPGCGKITLDYSGKGYKKCFATGCSYRVYSNGAISFLRYDTDKIRRIRSFFGEDEVVAEFNYMFLRKANFRVLKPGRPPTGRKVRLIKDYQVRMRLPANLPKEEFIIRETGVTRVKLIYDLSVCNPVIPTGTIGIVGEASMSNTIFNYDLECPVQFIYDPRVPRTVGVPWDILEFAD